MKWLKIVASVFFVVLLIAVVAMVSLATFVSPNRFKPLIVDQVKKYTGRDLVIDGDLSWTLVPTLGVKIGHLQLNNTPDFKQKVFAKMDSATISVKVLPLLHKRIESSGITIKGLTLNLIKNEKGQVNWADLQKPTSATDKSETPTVKPEETITPSPKRAAFGLAVSGIDVSNATVHWENLQAKQTFDLNKLEFHVKEITFDKPIPFNTSFTFLGTNPSVSGQFALHSELSVNLDKQLYTLRGITIKSKFIQDSKHFDISLKGDAAADLLKQKLQLDNLNGDISNLQFSGKAIVSNLNTKPVTNGHLSIQPFDVKKWLKDTGQDVAAVASVSNLRGDFDFVAGTSLPSVDLKGTLKIAEVKTSKIHINDINVQAFLKKGTLELSPFTATFYQGNVEGLAKVNLMTTQPQITLNAKLTSMQAESLLADLAPSDKLKMTGTGNIDLQVTTSGTSSEVITKNLNGSAKLNFTNGVLQGVDVGYVFDGAVAFARKQTNASSNTSQTPFGTLTATAVIRNGVVSNDDLKMDSPRFESTGKGTINLVTQKIQYQLQTKVKKTADQPNELLNMYGLPVPILITGDLSSPSVSLDTSVLMKAVAEQQIQRAKADVKEKIAEKIKDKLPAAAGDLLNNLLGN